MSSTFLPSRPLHHRPLPRAAQLARATAPGRRGLLAALAVIATSLSPGSAPAALHFTQVASQAGIDVVHDPLGVEIEGTILPNFYGSGLAWCEINHDGWPDLVISNGAVGSSIFLNNGDGTFDDVSAYFRQMPVTASAGLAMADMDNDGFQDIALANYFHEPCLLEGGRQVFVEKAEILGVDPLLFDAGQEPPGWIGPESTGVAWGDYDGDGYLDLYFANYRTQPDMLMESVRGRYFVRTTKVDVPSPETAWGFQPVFWDYDNDGDMDIYVTNDFGGNFLFENGGRANGWELVEVAARYKIRGGGGYPAPSSLSMGAAVGDYDNDLDLDLYVTNYFENELYINTGVYGTGPFGTGWRFKADQGASGVQYMWNNWGTEFFDADNDGDLDLVMTGGWIPSDPLIDQGRNIDNRFYLNNGAPDWKFTNVTAAVGFSDDTVSGRGLATADYDRDGDLDIAVWNCTYWDPVSRTIEQEGPFQLFRNDMDGAEAANHWAVFQLVGGGEHGPNLGCSASGVGSRVYVTTASGTQMREVRAGGSFLSQASLEAEFGLGQDETLVEVKVRWTCGDEEIFTGCTVDRFHKLVEGEGTPRPLPTAISGFQARSTPDGIELTWSQAPSLEVTSAVILRGRADGSPLVEQPLPVQWTERGGRVLDPDVEPGQRYAYRLELRGEGISADAQLEVTAGELASTSRRPVLGASFPNPYQSAAPGGTTGGGGVTILFELPEPMWARVAIYDVRGRLVRVLESRLFETAGRHATSWDGTDETGRRVAQGAYRYALETSSSTMSRGLTLVR